MAKNLVHRKTEPAKKIEKKHTKRIKPKKKLSNELTLKERKVVKAYIETGNKAEAGRRALSCKNNNSAQASASKMLSKERVQKTIVTLMEEMGITRPALLRTLRHGLIAKRIEVVKHEGKITEMKNFVDHNARHRFMTTGLELMGDLAQLGSADNPVYTKGLVMVLPAKQKFSKKDNENEDS